MTDDAEYYLDIIARLLKTKDYEWARPTLSGIAKTITNSGVLTPRQRQAVDHIMLGRLKHDVRS